MTTIIAIFLALFGAAIASFLSVVIHRVKSGKKGIVTGRSMCPHCKKQLKWHHLLPVFSFMALRGKCAFCNKKISKHYFALELLMAAVLVIVFLNFNFVATPGRDIDWVVFEKFVFYAVESVLLVLIFFYDLLYQEIPDRFSFPAIAIAIAGIIIFGAPHYLSALIGLGIIAVFFGGQIAISKGEWLGGGDLRLGAIMALLLGYESLIVSLVLSYLIGALVSIPLLLLGKATRKTAIPFGPFLITATFIGIFLGEEIIRVYFMYLLP